MGYKPLQARAVVRKVGRITFAFEARTILHQLLMHIDQVSISNTGVQDRTEFLYALTSTFTAPGKQRGKINIGTTARYLKS